jgi:hypothetical protein
MPVSLQPRAPRRCRLVQPEDHRAVPVSARGYRVRPGGHYQLEIAVAEEADQPDSVALVCGAVRRTSLQEQCVSEEGCSVRRIDVQIARDEEGLRAPRFWWSRLEPLAVRLHYGDGRDDYEQRLWLVIKPRRLWALLALLSSAVLYGVVPWLSRTILEQGDLPAVWSRVLQVLSRPEVWQGLMLVILGVWLMVVLTDRLQVWWRWRMLRHDVRREVQHYLQRVEHPR